MMYKLNLSCVLNDVLSVRVSATYLAGRLVKSLQEKQKEFEEKKDEKENEKSCEELKQKRDEDEKDVLCVQIAALCYNLGEHHETSTLELYTIYVIYSCNFKTDILASLLQSHDPSEIILKI